MSDQLPRELTKGVTATREGLYFHGSSNAKLCLSPAILLDDPHNGRHGDYWLRWPDAAERLRYREGEPWCGWGAGIWGRYVVGIDDSNTDTPFGRLHRLAAILCDDAEAFRVLHECITNLGGQ